MSVRVKKNKFDVGAGTKNKKIDIGAGATKSVHYQSTKTVTSAPGPRTPHSNKLFFSLGPAPRNSSANTTKHGPTPPPLHAHNSSTHSNLTFSSTSPQPLPGPHTLSSPPLPVPSLMIHSFRCVTAPLTRKKYFSVTYVTPVGVWTDSSPPSLPSLLGYENVPVYPSCPRIPRCTATSPLPLSHPWPWLWPNTT